MSELRRAVAASLAAAVVIGAGAGAASATAVNGYEGELNFTPGTWQEEQTDQAGGALQGPPERLEEAAQLGQVADAAEAAAKAQAQAAKTAAEHPEVAQEAAEAAAVAGEKVAELARQAEAQAAQEAQAATQPAEPTNLGAAGPAVVSVPGPVADTSLLEITADEMLGDFEQVNTAAEAAWQWLRLRGWRGIPGDGAEKLYAPSHPRYAETVLVGDLPESVWCYPILPGSDVTDHAADVLRAAGWFEADLYEPGGAMWLLPPEAAPF